MQTINEVKIKQSEKNITLKTVNNNEININ